MKRCLSAYAACCCLWLVTTGATAQMLTQSELEPNDVDPSFKLSLEHLSLDKRWLGLAPRELTWSADGAWVYFRWREHPEPGQLPEKDPWYAVNREGTEWRRVGDEEVQQIPSSNISWSGKRDLAAWTKAGTVFTWTPTEGTRARFTSARELGDLSVSWDGARVFFATQGFQSRSEDNGDLWVYEVPRAHVRQVAEVARKKQERAEGTKAGEWLKQQQLDLIAIVRKREANRREKEGQARRWQPYRAQRIPIGEGARAYHLQLSPDGRFLTFLWAKDPSSKHRTHYMEYVNETGYATDKAARPKVGEPLPEYKMGIVGVSPAVADEDIDITWVDDGVTKHTILHGPYWNPQGTHGVVQILSMDHKDRWISLLDVETGKTRIIDHQHAEDWIGGPLINGRWRPGFLRWLPQGDAFGFASEATGWSMLYLGYVDGRVTELTAGEYEVRRAELSPDGKTWYLTTSREHPGEEHFYHLPARGGALTRITAGEGKHRVVVSPDGKRLATRFETPQRLPDLYVLDNAPGAQMRRVTKSGSDAFYRYAWVESEIIHFADPAGRATWARIWKPPEKSNGAAVVYVHGCGECAQGVDKGWTRIGARLYANYLYQKGYVSASLDYRGSSGYGHSNRTYAYRQMGVSDVDSGLPLLDILVERYGIDRNRIGIYGGSYGGFFTLMSLFRHPGKYAAGVALYPVTDWAHYNQGYTSRILNGAPTADEEAYRRSSPIYYAKGLEGALQIQHGLVDNNVQIQDSFRLSEVLMELHKNFDFVVYPVEDHGWDEVPSRRDSYQRMTQWFDRHLLAHPLGAPAGEAFPAPR